MNAIETEQLTKRFRRVSGYRDLLRYRRQPAREAAVDAINLSVRRGELFGLLGENGAGKTTLIRMLTTTLLPTSGRALVGGHDVVEEPHRVRELIGLVSGDERSFYWRLTGRQNLWYFATLYHVPRRLIDRRINELLETLGVSEYADRRFDSYSTGTRQKFGIARGMLTDPQILFLDEPTRALDPIAADELRSYITGHIIGERGYTVFLATHALAEAEALCDRIAIMRRGSMIEVGTMSELSARMGLSSFVELVVDGATDQVQAALCQLPGVEGVDIGTTPAGARISVRLDRGRGSLSAVFQLLLDRGLRIDGCTTREPTLDDVYRAAHADA